MPKRGIAALAITAVALVLVAELQDTGRGSGTRRWRRDRRAGVHGAPSAASGGAAAPAAGATPDPTTSTGSGTGSAASGTVDGPVVDTRYGAVQVEIVVSGGQLTDVVALQLPTGRHSGQISTAVAPILRQEALQAKSAAIDTVSGATYTSDAYAQSLQAALDQAGLG